MNHHANTPDRAPRTTNTPPVGAERRLSGANHWTTPASPLSLCPVSSAADLSFA